MTYSTWAAKTSAINEIEQLPVTWRVEPLCAVLREIEKPNRGNVEQNLLSLSYGKIVRRDINSNDGLLPESFETYQIVEPSDIVLRLTDLQNDHRSLRVGYVPERGIITSAYLALKANNNSNPRYLYYLLHAYDLMKIFYGLGGGVRQSMKYADMKWLPMALPPVQGQAEIVTFLDRETAKADALAAKYERLIELLEAKRVALITQAVTKGLDPSVPMKDSGIEWIGQMPAHWDIYPLKSFFAFEKGKNAQLLTSEYIQDHPGDYPVYSGQTENDGIMGFIDSFVYDVPAVLFVTTVGARVMTPMRLSGKFNLSQNCMIGVPISCRVETDYFFYQLEPLFSFERAMIPSHMQPSLRIADMKRYRVAIPPHDERAVIARFLDEKCAQMNEMKRCAVDAIALIREHRAALITAAVTGQIDVRTYKARDLEEVVA